MRQASVTIALALLAALCAVALIGPLLALPLPLERANEGWNAVHAFYAFRRDLYPNDGAWIVNNYPPLWPILTGTLGTLAGDPIAAGRALAIFGYFGTACAIAFLLRQLDASSSASLVGALSWIAITAGLLGDYVGLNEPQMFAHMIVTFGVALVLGNSRRRFVIVAALLVVLGLFVKHLVLALPLATTIWLMIRRRHRLPVWIAAGATAAGLAVTACIVAYGASFILNMTFPRVLSWHRLGTNIALISKPAIPLIAFSLVAFRRKALRDDAMLFAALAILCGILEIVAFGAAQGVSINIVFDLVIAACIGFGLALDRLPRVTRHAALVNAALVAALIVRVSVGMPNPLRFLGDGDLAQARDTQSRDVVTVSEILDGIDDPVACEALASCAYGGHASEADLWKLRFETTLSPFMNTTSLLDDIAACRFKAVVTYGDLTSAQRDLNLPGLYASLRACYVSATPIGTSFILFSQPKF